MDIDYVSWAKLYVASGTSPNMLELTSADLSCRLYVLIFSRRFDLKADSSNFQRKMTTLLILASRTGTPASVLIPRTFNAPKLTIPKAPSLGLLLQEPRFGTYNKHVTDENELAVEHGQTERVRELIEWEPLRERIDEFKRTFIYARLREEETKHGV
jgi:hypothetical protein